MKATSTRTRLSVVHTSMVVSLSLTAGCVRELTELEVQEFSLTPDAAFADTSHPFTATFDAGTLDAEASDTGVAAPESWADAQVTWDAARARDAGSGDGGLIVVEAGHTAMGNEAASLHEDASAGRPASTDAPSMDVPGTGDADASIVSQNRVFAIAAAVEPETTLPSVPVFSAHDVVIDGDNSEWSNDGWFAIATPDSSIGEPESSRDLSAVGAIRWNTTRLYLAVVVMDELHVNDAGGYDIWGGDSVQVAFDVGQGRLPYDWEYGFAATSRGLNAHRWREGDADVTQELAFAVRRYAELTVYEVAFEPRHLGVSEFPVEGLRLSVAVNDNDGKQRSAAIELVQGIVGHKRSADFPFAQWR